VTTENFVRISTCSICDADLGPPGSLEAANGNDLPITDETTGDQIDIQNQFYTSGDEVETRAFSGGGTMNLSSGFVTASSSTTTLNGTAGNDTLIASGGGQTLTGDGGTDTYDVAIGLGQDTIINGVSGSAAGILNFGPSISDTQLWFDRVDGPGNVSSTGNNFRMDILGTADSVTINGWFNSSTPYAQLSEIETSGSDLKIDSQVNNLVQAMATSETNYQSTYGIAFNPAAIANSNITDSTAVNSAWHS
jgi:hypothetical protein